MSHITSSDLSGVNYCCEDAKYATCCLLLSSNHRSERFYEIHTAIAQKGMMFGNSVRVFLALCQVQKSVQLYSQAFL
jgi:hypothetical protein